MNKQQKEFYDAFYESTHDDGVLDKKVELLVGLASAISLNCEPCTVYYLNLCKKNGVTKYEIQSVIAKVMAVAAGQKRLQSEEILTKFRINLDEFE